MTRAFGRFAVAGLLLFLALVLACCTGSPAGPPPLPRSAGFGWKLGAVTKTATGWQADYSGPGMAHVDAVTIHSMAEGLDKTQHFRAAAQTVTVFNAHYFLVIQWQGANQAAATALVGQIERSLPKSE